MEDVREGNVVMLRGYLISARHPNGATWNSSLTRDDTGNGACELVLLEQIHWL